MFSKLYDYISWRIALRESRHKRNFLADLIAIDILQNEELEKKAMEIQARRRSISHIE